MKPVFTKKSSFEKNSSIEQNFTPPQFPKIAEVDPDEKKKKKEEEEKEIHNPNIFSKELNTVETAKASLQTIGSKSLEELSTPIIEKIHLQTKSGVKEYGFIIQTKTLGEVEVHLSMYDTDPFSFHIKLLGNAKLQELSMKHQSILTNRMRNTLPHIRLHIAPPALRKKDRYKVKDKKSVEKTKTSWYGAVKGGS